MMRVVPDTNVVVSAALTPSGPSFQIIELASQQLIQLWMSPATLAECEDVLNRPRVGIEPIHAKTMISWLKKISQLTTPTKVVTSSPDPKDNMFLECAEAAKAHYLVTGNIRDFPQRWKYTSVVTPRQFFNLFGTPPIKIRR